MGLFEVAKASPIHLTQAHQSADIPQVMDLVGQFHQFARKSAEGVLEMARVVQAASLLQGSDFHRFCERTKLKPGAATTRKLITIGEKYSFLITQADKLPASWTTVYAVARLANEQIQALIDQGVVNTHTAAAELERALSTRVENRLARAVTIAAAADASLHEEDAQAESAQTAPRSVVANPPQMTSSSRLSLKLELVAPPNAATLKTLKRLIQQLSTTPQAQLTLSDAMTQALQQS
jgi:hypothetical protein